MDIKNCMPYFASFKDLHKRFRDWYNEYLYFYFYLYYQYRVTISHLFYLLLKYGWDRAYLAVILVSGLLSSIIKSRL